MSVVFHFIERSAITPSLISRQTRDIKNKQIIYYTIGGVEYGVLMYKDSQPEGFQSYTEAQARQYIIDNTEPTEE